MRLFSFMRLSSPAIPLPPLTFPTERCDQGPEPANKEAGTVRLGSARAEEAERLFSRAQGTGRRGALPLGEQTLLRREKSAPLDQRDTGPSEQVDSDFGSGGFRGQGRQAAVDSGHSVGYSAPRRKFRGVQRSGGIKKGNCFLFLYVFTLLFTEGVWFAGYVRAQNYRRKAPDEKYHSSRKTIDKK